MIELPKSFIGQRWRHGDVKSVSKNLRNSLIDDDVPEEIRKEVSGYPIEDGWGFLDKAFALLPRITPEGSKYKQNIVENYDEYFGFVRDDPDKRQQQ